ncbi:MAG: phosphoribosylformylglycinamidine synthase, partial [Muribaculaceae bacterium]|nr:phosphoribosylformylglycinamidine synthase [Muribaculaceae bacterium]
MACKDWLTNKVDRSVTGRVVRQQCAGALQLPVNDYGAVCLDYRGTHGVATSIGHAPQVALSNVEAGSRLAVAEALTNIVGAGITGHALCNDISGVSLSANWMWPCKNPGEDAALYRAVEACSDFVCALGCNIPTGKDSLSMTQKYPDGTKVTAPGTVIISASANTANPGKMPSAAINPDTASTLYYIDFSGTPLALGGSALAQTLSKMGGETPDVADPAFFAQAFNTVSDLCKKGYVDAIHDVSAGGLVTTLLEMCFPNTKGGLNFYTDGFAMYGQTDLVKILFAENPAVVIQVSDRYKRRAESYLDMRGVRYFPIASPAEESVLTISHTDKRTIMVSIPAARRRWYEPSFRFDSLQTEKTCAESRFRNFDAQPVRYH